jgi:hypothetical protein
MGAPVDVGAHVGGRAIEHRHEKQKIPTSFVFAYRIREVRYFKKGDTVAASDYTKGAELHGLYATSRVVEPCADKNVTYEGADYEIDIDGVSEEDFEENESDTTIVDDCFMIKLK